MPEPNRGDPGGHHLHPLHPPKMPLRLGVGSEPGPEVRRRKDRRDTCPQLPAGEGTTKVPVRSVYFNFALNYPLSNA